MASVMIGGMVPPLAIALCTLLFKNKFTAKERQSGVTNFIMGLSFITEGAIPFVASDPSRNSFFAHSVVLLQVLFLNTSVCSVPAPHGGIFVFGVVHNWSMYFLALVIGSVIAKQFCWVF